MKSSEITVENYEKVYEYFRGYRPNRNLANSWSIFANFIYKPRVNYAVGARKDLDLIHNKDYHHIYVFNHRGNWDGYTSLSTLRQIAPNDIGNIRAMVTVLCFENRIMSYVYRAAGLIPVFLKSHHVNARRHRNHQERLKLIPAANESMFDCLTHVQTEQRQKILIYPEGKFNTGAPNTLLPVRKGVAEIAHRVAKIDSPIVITTIGVAYSKKRRRYVNPRNASVFVGRSIFVEPGMTTDEITDLVRTRLLSSVKKAVALY